MRDLTSDHKTQLAAKLKRTGLLVEILYDTPLRVWTGHTDITWDGKTWYGLSVLGGISAIEEQVGVRADVTRLTINGVDTEQVVVALDPQNHSREVQIWLATFTESGGTWSVVDSPNRMVWGETDVHEIIEDDEAGTIEVSVEGPLCRLTRANPLRYTTADQQRLHPEDKFFDYAEDVATKTLYWPNRQPTNNSGSSGDDALEPQD